MGLIHQHLLLRIELNKPGSYIDDPEFWEAFIDTMITDQLDMQIAMPARAVLVEDPDNYGITGSANLTTSHISWHVWSRTDPIVIQMDVYSCRQFDTKALIDWIVKILDEREVRAVAYRVLDRNDDNTYFKSWSRV